jgi:hypothetical protein
MADSISVECHKYRYFLQWYSDGEEGAQLGETLYTPKQLEEATVENRWFISATIAVEKHGAERDSGGFHFETHAKANAALRVAKAAKNAKRAMPDWALKATAEGWKPPKGWQP